jgi:WXG100 family type VII secretion target
MSKTFETDSAEMAAMGNKVLENAEQIAAEVEGLISRLEGVDWRGQAADSFHAAKEDWRTQVTNIKQQLDDVAECLGVSASNYDNAHQASTTGYEHLRGQNLPI